MFKDRLRRTIDAERHGAHRNDKGSRAQRLFLASREMLEARAGAADASSLRRQITIRHHSRAYGKNSNQPASHGCAAPMGEYANRGHPRAVGWQKAASFINWG